MTNIVRLDVGILSVSWVRNALRAMKFSGCDIEWEEGDGWIERPFFVKGAHAKAACHKIIELLNG